MGSVNARVHTLLKGATSVTCYLSQVSPCYLSIHA